MLCQYLHFITHINASFNFVILKLVWTVKITVFCCLSAFYHKLLDHETQKISGVKFLRSMSYSERNDDSIIHYKLLICMCSLNADYVSR